LIRLGLFLYDNLGGRKILPRTTTLDLQTTPEGAPLQDRFLKAYEYSDCWVDDARLVVLNARDAAQRGAEIMVKTKVLQAKRHGDLWEITTQGPEGQQTHFARALINAGGPWVKDVIRDTVESDSKEGVRLVRGSHIVTKRLFEHDRAYFFQGTDGRIIFAIPYEEDFTCIGTTDQDHTGAPETAECSRAEADYLRDFAGQYFKTPIAHEDIIWSYSGVRPLYDDGASSATAATREYVLSLDITGTAPLLNVFGGKITTYRKLAEAALEKLSPHIKGVSPKWTARVPLPGGDFPVTGRDELTAAHHRDYTFLPTKTLRRLTRAYGTEVGEVLGDARTEAELGLDFGHGLYEAEVRWMIAQEFATTVEDILWRRSKLRLHMPAEGVAALEAYLAAR
jgi:glycerol-3-phosphate dehydrogenase